MEKLVELLNEFEIEKPARDYTWKIEKQNETRLCWTEYTWAYVDDEETERIIISKKYKFIEWLVREEKIDLLKLNFVFRYTDIIVGNFSWEDRIIMILSIEEDPIEFLISALK